MTFSEAIKKIAHRYQKITAGKINSDFIDLAKSEVNNAYLDVGKSWRWPHLETYGSIVGEPIVTGSATITNGSQTVTISGALTAWKGWFFRKKDGENSYRIANVTGTTVTLDQPIAESSGSVEFEIEKRFYTLPTEVRELGPYDAHEDTIIRVDNRGFRSTFPNYNPPLLDIPFHVHGSDKYTDDYTTGTATTTAGSDVVTGSGTSWLANVRPGNIFLFQSIEYRVRRGG